MQILRDLFHLDTTLIKEMVRCSVGHHSFLIGYSSVQIAIGYCYAMQESNQGLALVLLRKTSRFPFQSIGNRRVHRYGFFVGILILLYVSLFPSRVWIPGISRTSCSLLERLAIRYLYWRKRVSFYDDGMAGVIPNTYTWMWTRRCIPNAHGSLTWNHELLSPLFRTAALVDIRLLRRVNSCIDVNSATASVHVNAFIEANAMNASRLEGALIHLASDKSLNLYYAHTDKPSVSRDFKGKRLFSGLTYKLHMLSHCDYRVLEPHLMETLDQCLSLAIFSGATSTILLLFAYAQQTCQHFKLRLYISPDYALVDPGKIEQSIAFYDYVRSRYPEQLHIV